MFIFLFEVSCLCEMSFNPGSHGYHGVSRIKLILSDYNLDVFTECLAQLEFAFEAVIYAVFPVQCLPTGSDAKAW